MTVYTSGGCSVDLGDAGRLPTGNSANGPPFMAFVTGRPVNSATTSADVIFSSR
jgi:hypothetical protein